MKSSHKGLITMSQIKEWEYDNLASLCKENRKLYIDAVLYNGNKSIKWSAWLRLMGLMETWDMKDG